MKKLSDGPCEAATISRLRRLFSERRIDATEKPMIGGRGFLVNGILCCGVSGDDLVLRLIGAARERALREASAQPMKFGVRTLSAFVRVGPDGFATDRALAKWVDAALEVTASLSAKKSVRPPPKGRSAPVVRRRTDRT